MKASSKKPAAGEILRFKKPAEFRKWLAKYHAVSLGIWLSFAKKGSAERSISYAQALDQALCYGWIDALKKPFDEHSWIQRFTPRRPKGHWSKINTEHARRLIQAKQMTPAGLKAIEAAQKDGRWETAYDSPANSTVPEDFLKELRKNKKAQAFFETLNKTNLYSITYRLQTAKKPETRLKRMKLILEMLARGEKFH